MQQNYFKIFSLQEAGVSGNGHIKGTVKATLKIEKLYIKNLQRIIALPAIQRKW